MRVTDNSDMSEYIERVALVAGFALVFVGGWHYGAEDIKKHDAAQIAHFQRVAEVAQFGHTDCQVKLTAQNDFFRDNIYTTDGHWVSRKNFKL